MRTCAGTPDVRDSAGQADCTGQPGDAVVLTRLIEPRGCNGFRCRTTATASNSPPSTEPAAVIGTWAIGLGSWSAGGRAASLRWVMAGPCPWSVVANGVARCWRGRGSRTRSGSRRFEVAFDVDGGTAGVLQGQAPAPLDGRDYGDAVVVSTENTLSEALSPSTANP